MQASGVILAANISVNAATTPVAWRGGRTAIVIQASAYPTTCQLQLQGPNGGWININGTTYSADQTAAYDLPAGQYRLNMTGGTATAVYANLVGVPYG